MRIPFFDYRPHYARMRPEIDEAIRRVIDSGRLVLGPEVEGFEKEFAAWVGAGGAVGVNSGTDALVLALRALSIGRDDEVVTVANAGTPVVAAIRAVGAIPRFVDVENGTLSLDPGALDGVVNERTRCIVPVHLYGQPARIEAIVEFAQRRGLDVVEDCAQAHGALAGGRHVGTFGRVGCFSFYPTKNLGALGDGGICVSDDDGLLERLRALRMYGYDDRRVSRLEGVNSRLDELQAAILRVGLSHLDDTLRERRELAERYKAGLASCHGLALPDPSSAVEHAYHLFVVRHAERDRLIETLGRDGIGCSVHYPCPVHLMPAYRWLRVDAGHLPVTEAACRSVLSIPLYPGLPGRDVDRVVETLSRAVG